MKVIKAESYQELSDKAAEIVLQTVKSNPKAVLGLATGSTPIGLYKNMIKDHKKNGTSYKQVHTFNLDEYVGLGPDHPQSYAYFMREHLFDHIDIPAEQTFIPDGKAEDLEKECKEYEEKIKQYGGIDLLVLGIGPNGHIGFNEPGTPFTSRTHVVELTEETRKANSRFFDSIDEVPSQAISMGIGTIMESKKIILLIAGNKAEAYQRLMDEEPNENMPATVLKNHPDVTVIVDREKNETA